MLELHCHTTYSDGTLTPAQLVTQALVRGVQALAITDHDTLAGWDEAVVAAQGQSLEIIPGLELSTVHQNCSMHILGFYPDRDQLQPFLNTQIAGRQRRAQAMVDKLALLGYPITLPQFPNSAAPGRPHIAAALVEAGYVQSSQDAFERWLRDGGLAYEPYETVSAEDGIRVLRECGAVPVWAHPGLFRGEAIETTLPTLVKAGLMGLEVYHPHHSASESRQLVNLCNHYGLVMTGGSDYHGPSPGKKLGESSIALNQLHLPLSLLPPLKQAAATLQVHRLDR